jgi:hypothetical protein
LWLKDDAKVRGFAAGENLAQAGTDRCVND